MTQETNYTPAPWRVQTFAALDGYEVVSDSWDVVSASLRPAAPIRKLSDARLIAAAPDLLEALIVALRNIPKGPSSLRWQIEAAIAKATEGEG